MEPIVAGFVVPMEPIVAGFVVPISILKHFALLISKCGNKALESTLLEEVNTMTKLNLDPHKAFFLLYPKNTKNTQLENKFSTSEFISCLMRFLI